jgi:hypothetical protein
MPCVNAWSRPDSQDLDIICVGSGQGHWAVELARIWRELSAEYNVVLVEMAGDASRENDETFTQADFSISAARLDHTPTRLVEVPCERLQANPTIIVMNATARDDSALQTTRAT